MASGLQVEFVRPFLVKGLIVQGGPTYYVRLYYLSYVMAGADKDIRVLMSDRTGAAAKVCSLLKPSACQALVLTAFYMF